MTDSLVHNMVKLHFYKPIFPFLISVTDGVPFEYARLGF